ncbi:hypothetical protein PIIN_03056 [Serendipita indica DSM 11827]|uniref:Xylanolytic transcriptional activator regulatory domain-containing protein n=1 Tax=Serendipita indica (strain DSM 11827) TaxID=1109443 RepID=G4TCY2_SERID|nr:hypothetical protein PIIN_03056 [Serendipita indica DSM 11827]
MGKAQPVAVNGVPPVLKRNMKCDAQRPCSTCKRSHANALATQMPGTDVPPEPVCTYDELPEPKDHVERMPGDGGTRGRYERLESRIAELEAQLREREQLDAYTSLRAQLSPLGRLSISDPFDQLYQQQQLPNLPFDSNNVLWPNWPERLPAPPLLHNLAETFFSCHPHATRLLHRPTFMASLALPPNHADFPALSLLHAICALASLWSPLVERRDVQKSPQEGDSPVGRGDWFGELHARWSREEEEKNATEGTSVFQGLQSIVVLTWYYYAHARWVEVWLYTSKALRYAVPMGLNTTPTHGPLLRSWTMPSILGPPKNAIESEMRRTTFWLAYCYERWQAASTGWAMGLDDEDISQVLPLPLVDFEQGLSILPELRQRISTPRMLTLHIPEQTDAFTLYVKGTILFSKVKNFNIRFKSKYYYAVASNSAHGERFAPFGGMTHPPPQPQQQVALAQHQQQQQMEQVQDDVKGEGTASPDGSSNKDLPYLNTSYQSNSTSTPSGGYGFGMAMGMGSSFSPIGMGPGPERIDPRDTPSFRAVDGLIEGFRTSFPKNLRDPVAGGRVNSELYVACLVPHVATILLHDPHADPAAPTCRSAEKLLIAARAILDLVSILCATSFDITLLDPVASFAWFLAARVFVRFLRARLDGRRHAEAVVLRKELEVIRIALKRMGERVPLGYRQSKMLDDLLASEVGNALDTPAAHAFAFANTSPDGQTTTLPLSNNVNASPSGGFSADTASLYVAATAGHRGSFSAPNGHVDLSIEHLAPQNPSGLARSGTANGGLPLPDAANTKNMMLHDLPPMLLPELHGYDPLLPPSAPESATALHTPSYTFGVAEIHQKFLESMKSQDEILAAANSGPNGLNVGGGGRLEMLLGEMVDDGDEGVFGGVAGMGVLGAMGDSGIGIGAGVGVAGAGIGYVNDYTLVNGGAW